jgi:hypothetical protein
MENVITAFTTEYTVEVHFGIIMILFALQYFFNFYCFLATAYAYEEA